MNASAHKIQYAYILGGGVMAAFMILLCLFRNFVLLLFLSFVGSVLVVYGLGYIVGALPNASELLD